MKEVLFSYGKTKLPYSFRDEELVGVLTSSIEEYVPTLTQEQLIEEALMNPVDSLPLCELAKGKEKVVIIASDHTRPVPSKLMIPPMLREIRKGNPEADITILIATGCHRGTTKEELVYKFGEEIVAVHLKDFTFDEENRKSFAVAGTGELMTELIFDRLEGLSHTPEIILDETKLELYEDSLKSLSEILD